MKTPVEKAQEYFRGGEGYNCAQALVKAFEGYGPKHDADNLSAYAHGGAENGKCGALLATQFLCPREFSQEIEQRFIEKAGSAQCRQIRQLKQLGCRLCVAEAARLTQEYLEKDKS